MFSEQFPTCFLYCPHNTDSIIFFILQMGKPKLKEAELRVNSKTRIRIPELLTSNPVLFLIHGKWSPIHTQFLTLPEIRTRKFLETFLKREIPGSGLLNQKLQGGSQWVKFLSFQFQKWLWCNDAAGRQPSIYEPLINLEESNVKGRRTWVKGR